jgi:hypothetical protein
MTTAPLEINGKSFTRTLNAVQHLGWLIADIDATLIFDREPTAMTKLLDERLVLQRAHCQLVEPMCEAARTMASSTPAPDTLRMLDLLMLDALADDLDAQIATATGNQLTALNFRQAALKRVIAALRDVAQASRTECPATDDSEEDEEKNATPLPVMKT